MRPHTGMGARDPVFGLSLRQPPANLQAEQSLLGGLMVNNKAYERVSDFLRPEHFADRAHGLIYAAIARRIDAGQVADVVTLRPEFENAGVLDEVGGAAYLAELLSAMVSILNVGEYGRLIEDAWARRQLIDACEVAVNRAFGAEAELAAPQIVESLDAALLALSEGRDAQAVETSARVADQVVDAFFGAVRRRGALAGVTTGYRGFDRMTGGLRKGEMIVIGARPSMGKTALSTGMAVRAAQAGHKVLFVSAEMLAWGVMARATAAVAGLPVSAVLRAGQPDPSGAFQPFAEDGAEARRVVSAARRLSALPLWWDQQPAATVAGIRSRARRLKRQEGLDLVVVDYLGRCRGTPEAVRLGKVAEVTEMSSHFKAMAMELAVPVVLLSQLNRQNEGRDDQRPRLSDLRDSGAIEQDADLVAFIHRPHYYLKRARPAKKPREKGEEYEARLNEWYAQLNREEGRAELDIAKQRQGPVGPVELRFADDLTWFFDRDDGDDAVPGLPRE